MVDEVAGEGRTIDVAGLNATVLPHSNAMRVRCEFIQSLDEHHRGSGNAQALTTEGQFTAAVGLEQVRTLDKIDRVIGKRNLLKIFHKQACRKAMGV